MNRTPLSILFASLLFFTTWTEAFSAEENFIILDGMSNEIVAQEGPHLDDRATPACSFNIVLSLMGYDTGVLEDENRPIWDFKEGYDDFSESWKTSLTPQSWMNRSSVWYSKILALNLGLETIQRYLIQIEYGNQDMSGGLAIPGPLNSAWISSSLAISPREQVVFIHKMMVGKLPVSETAIQKTKLLLFKEELANGWKLYGKTGMGTFFYQDGINLKVRWFVGWIENDTGFFPFAYQMRDKVVDVSQTVPRVKKLLEQKLSYRADF